MVVCEVVRSIVVADRWRSLPSRRSGDGFAGRVGHAAKVRSRGKFRITIEQVNSDKLNVVSYRLRSKLKVASWCNVYY